MNIESILGQTGIVFFGGTAVFLVGLKEDNKWQRWGYVCGLCAQPFWYYTTWKAEQYGIFVMSMFYSYSWFNGFKNRWI